MNVKKLTFRFLLISLFNCAFAFGIEKSAKDLPESLENTQGKIIQQEKEEDLVDLSNEKDNKPMVDALHAIIFIDNPDEMKRVPGDVQEDSIEIELIKVPDGKEKKFVRKMRNFLGKPISRNLLKQIAQEVIVFYRKHDRYIVDVIIPAGQDITNGVLQIAVITGVLDNVVVTHDDNPYFSDKRIRSGFTTKKGEELNGKRLAKDLRWINNNPFRTVDLVLSEGDQFAETDVTLNVKDRLPLRLYVGGDNTGTPIPDEKRFFAGINWGDVLGLDHQLNYQFTTTDDINLLKANSISYIAPLPWRHTLKCFFSYSNVDPGASADLDTKSQSWYGGINYIVPLPDLENIIHEMYVGYEFKQTDSDIFFVGDNTINFGSLRDVSQFLIGYNASRADKHGATSLGFLVHLSPGGMTNFNDVSDYTKVRSLSNPSYTYVTFNFQRVVLLPREFSFILTFDGQLTTRNLLSSEQFGLGGYYTVRGYREFEVNVDNGYVVRTELRSPSFGVLSSVCKNKLGKWNFEDNAQLLLFFDYGGGSREDKVADDGPQASSTLMGAGFGVRYGYLRNFSARFDMGWRLKKTDALDPASSPRDWRIHLGATASL